MKICKNFYVTFSLRNLMNMKNISYETPLMQPWNANNLYVFNWSQHQVPCQKFWHNQQFETKLHIILKRVCRQCWLCPAAAGHPWVKLGWLAGWLLSSDVLLTCSDKPTLWSQTKSWKSIIMSLVKTLQKQLRC